MMNSGRASGLPPVAPTMAGRSLCTLDTCRCVLDMPPFALFCCSFAECVLSRLLVAAFLGGPFCLLDSVFVALMKRVELLSMSLSHVAE